MEYRVPFFFLLIVFIISAYYIYKEFIKPYNKMTVDYPRIDEHVKKREAQSTDNKRTISELKQHIESIEKGNNLPPDVIRDNLIKALEEENHNLEMDIGLTYSFLHEETKEKYNTMKVTNK